MHTQIRTKQTKIVRVCYIVESIPQWCEVPALAKPTDMICCNKWVMYLCYQCSCILLQMEKCSYVTSNKKVLTKTGYM